MIVVPPAKMIVAAQLRPKPGDCCVFCSFGSVKCPPIQEQRG
jgi:hypothetical protein